MYWNNKKLTLRGRGGLVPAELIPQVYASEKAAWESARLLHEDEVEINNEINGEAKEGHDGRIRTIYIVEKTHGILIGELRNAPNGVEEHPPTCDRCGEPKARVDLFFRDPEPGKLYGERICRACLQAEIVST